MKRQTYTNLDFFLAMNNFNIPNPTPPKSFEEARRDVYFLKVIDLIWFDGILPKTKGKRQEFYLNTNWPTEPPPDGMPGISALDESALEWICIRMKRPVWANNQNLIKDFSFLDIAANMHK